MLQPKRAELDKALHDVLAKIEDKTVTCEDFNTLIKKTVIGETSPEGVRDRLRRRTSRNATDSHIEPETGHQPLQDPSLAKRVQPKITPQHQQSHGRSRIAHQHSARTQAQDAQLKPSFEFIAKNQGNPITEDMLRSVTDPEVLKETAIRLLNNEGVDKKWLWELVEKL